MVFYSNPHPMTKVHPPLEYNTIWTQRSGVSWHAQNSKCSDLTPPCSDWTSDHCNGNIGFGLDSMDRQPIPWDLRQIARNCTGVPKSKAGLDCTNPPPHFGGVVLGIIIYIIYILGLRLVSHASAGAHLSPAHLIWTPATPAGPSEQRQDSVDFCGN